MTVEAEDLQKVSEIQTRIAQLEALSEVDLRNEMASLKKSLLENPSACMLLMEEDIGMLVTSLRKMLGIAIASASAKKEAKTKSAKIDTQQALNLLEALEL